MSLHVILKLVGHFLAIFLVLRHVGRGNKPKTKNKSVNIIIDLRSMSLSNNIQIKRGENLLMIFNVTFYHF